MHLRSVREKCLYLDFSWFIFSRIRTEYGEILRMLRIEPECGKIRFIICLALMIQRGHRKSSIINMSYHYNKTVIDVKSLYVTRDSNLCEYILSFYGVQK